MGGLITGPGGLLGSLGGGGGGLQSVSAEKIENGGEEDVLQVRAHRLTDFCTLSHTLSNTSFHTSSDSRSHTPTHIPSPPSPTPIPYTPSRLLTHPLTPPPLLSHPPLFSTPFPDTNNPQ